MARRPKPVHQMTEAQFEARFVDEEACATYLVARRWPEGVTCPRCGNPKVFPVGSMPFKWQCYQCETVKGAGYRFSHIAGTIFENTNKPLRDWFKVVHLMTISKKGISALQIQRQMGFGSYGTAHSMCHKIRAAMVQPQEKLGGIVEIDETYIGGKDINRHWHKKKGNSGDDKTPVIGAVQRKGNVVARVLEKITSQAVIDFVGEAVSNKVSLLATDAWPGYSDYLGQYPHASVDHHKRQYVVGAVHTNTIEGFWPIFKRVVVGNRANADIFGAVICGC